MTSWFDNADEIIILFRDKDTGRQSYIRLADIEDSDVSWVYEFDDPEEISLYGGLASVKPNSRMTACDLTLTARGAKMGYARDLEETPVEKMRGTLHGDQP